MSVMKKRNYLVDSQEGAQIKHLLRLMELDQTFHTEASYSANGILHNDHVISFSDKHWNYLNNNPQVDPTHYLANLRLMTRVR
ncbi:MAG TPA: hypothetical protein VLE74_02725 [Candidatus Saccharimonadales bacterium]|nr:hypothetical protein [Candidatus Saccharimonadales bacterium]